MATGITFDTREAAVEYSGQMHDKGYMTETTIDRQTGKFRVILKAGVTVPPEEEFPATAIGIIKEEEEAEAEVEVLAGYTCYGAHGDTRRACLRSGGQWVTKAEAKALKQEETAQAKYTPIRPPTSEESKRIRTARELRRKGDIIAEREAKKQAARFGPKGLLRKPPEEIPARLLGEAGRIGTTALTTATGRMVGVKAGMKSAIPTTTIPSRPVPMEGSIGLNGRQLRIASGDAIGADSGRTPRIMPSGKSSSPTGIRAPTGIPYLKKSMKEDKEEE